MILQQEIRPSVKTERFENVHDSLRVRFKVEKSPSINRFGVFSFSFLLCFRNPLDVLPTKWMFFFEWFTHVALHSFFCLFVQCVVNRPQSI
jgi:hypothetical protein